MAGAAAFEWTCREIERQTPLDRLESRGTVRIALRGAGLEAASVLPDRMRVVIEKLLPRELAIRGVTDATSLCERLAAELGRLERDLGPERARLDADPAARLRGADDGKPRGLEDL